MSPNLVQKRKSRCYVSTRLEERIPIYTDLKVDGSTQKPKYPKMAPCGEKENDAILAGT
jgi:hypothetical protein